MQKKKDLIKLTEIINKLRQEYESKTFSRTELEALFAKIGVSKPYFTEFCKQKLFLTERIGQEVIYAFSKSPIYKGVVEKVYETVRASRRKPEEKKKVFLTEENAISLLKTLGYRIFKVEGIDVKKLQAEKPEIFEAYKLEKEV